MSSLLQLISQFRRDERGAFAVMFGVIAIVLIALGGATVDYVSMEQTKSRAQNALDAAALALQPEIFGTTMTTEQIRQRAEALMRQQVGMDNVTSANVTNISVDVALGTLRLEGRIVVPTIFVGLVGVNELVTGVRSQATRRLLDLEVAMVLDNSGSMAGTPMNNLKTAACNAVNILYFDRSNLGCKLPSGSPTPNPNVRMAVVPFTSLVNIGTQFANEPWLDWTGQSSVSRNNFDDDDDETTPFLGQVNRRTLFTQTSTTWQGCVEARIAPYDTTDDAPNSSEKLFLPMFSPDTYNTNNNYITSDSGPACKPKTCTQRVQRSCSGNKTNCNGTQTYTYTKSSAGVDKIVPTSCVPSGKVVLSGPTTTYPNNSTQVITTVYDIPLTNREKQNRLCKYNGTPVSSSSTNYTCPSASLLPLTGTPATILSRVDAMVASGNTNIQQGAVWGMHALTIGEPLTQAAARSPGQIAKVLIIMTDGKNEPNVITSTSDLNGSTYFSWGFRYDGRLGPVSNVNTATKLTDEMDKRTKAVCDYAKNTAGIEIYTIGLNASAATKTMLSYCASSSEHDEFPNSASELNAVFERIAQRLAALRLSL